ncbi:RNA-binding protein [Candidatus Woesebacteria bacterium]|nr:RNA-binding protein [Candidatus Woesebacteria bacterium]
MTTPNKLFVGNLPFAASQSDLEELFGQFGPLTSVHLVTDRFSGRPKGFAFVEYENADAAQAAIRELHGKDYQGRDLVVNEARPKTDAPRRSFDRNNDRNGRQGGYNN